VLISIAASFVNSPFSNLRISHESPTVKQITVFGGR